MIIKSTLYRNVRLKGYKLIDGVHVFSKCNLSIQHYSPRCYHFLLRTGFDAFVSPCLNPSENLLTLSNPVKKIHTQLKHVVENTKHK